IAVHPALHDDRFGAELQGLEHRHGGPHALDPGDVAGGGDDAAAPAADDDGLGDGSTVWSPAVAVARSRSTWKSGRRTFPGCGLPRRIHRAS
ncbi:MAG: hypothetical protein R6W76_10230, partial [Caldilinea sp.]